MKPLAVIADIHGNHLALEAVLRDIKARSITNIVNLGDSLDRYMNPGVTADLLMEHGIPTLLGNDESATPEQLTEHQLAWRDSLPKTLELGGDIFCCHGTPTSDTQALLEDITATGVKLAEADVILERLSTVTADLILCAHTHTPNAVRLPSGQLVVNPGSVGLPAYDHDDPVPHVMQVGSPHARYAVIQQEKGWSVQHIALTYDWQAAAKIAGAGGRPDRAEWLLTGRASL